MASGINANTSTAHLHARARSRAHRIIRSCEIPYCVITNGRVSAGITLNEVRKTRTPNNVKSKLIIERSRPPTQTHARTPHTHGTNSEHKRAGAMNQSDFPLSFIMFDFNHCYINNDAIECHRTPPTFQGQNEEKGALSIAASGSQTLNGRCTAAGARLRIETMKNEKRRAQKPNECRLIFSAHSIIYIAHTMHVFSFARNKLFTVNR